ncbi:MAG: hypothetical protein IJK21_03060 [Prevotella sp.]|nr:hypothetical protein [Prevotella sp.]
MNRFLFCVLFIISFTSCQDDILADDNIIYEDIYNLNKNVIGLKAIGRMIMEGDYIVSYNNENQESCKTIKLLIGENKTESEVLSYKNEDCPKLSFKFDNDRLYWTLNDTYILDDNGNRILVINNKITPLFKYEDNNYHVSTNDGKTWKLVWGKPITKQDIKIATLDSPYFLKFTIDSDFTINIPTENLAKLIRKEIKNKAFYKDVFHDAGAYLTSRTSLPAVSYLKLSYERMTCDADENSLRWQRELIGGTDEDENGRLLFPDEQPRYKLLFVNGGDSRAHGKSLDVNARDNMRKFVKNGGSYVGTCAGAFLACEGYDSYDDYPYYLSIWPGKMQHTGISNSKTGMYIMNGSPLLNYYNFGNDNYVADIRHNKGGYPSIIPEGTEILAYYDCPDYETVHMRPSVWSYKANSKEGRIVLEGSHPEEVASGERRDLAASMIRYAIDYVGNVQPKGFLLPGITRNMDFSTSDSIPALTKIGDLQCHHFLAYIPENAYDIKFELSSPTNCQLNIMLSRNTYAFAEDAEFVNDKTGDSKSLSFDTLPAGLWYVAVQNLTTVDGEDGENGQEYKGRTDILNGVPYSITVLWDE